MAITTGHLRSVVVANELRVNPGPLCRGSDHIFSATHDAAKAFAGYENALGEAAPGWVGASQRALTELAAFWEDLHAVLSRAG